MIRISRQISKQAFFLTKTICPCFSGSNKQRSDFDLNFVRNLAQKANEGEERYEEPEQTEQSGNELKPVSSMAKKPKKQMPDHIIYSEPIQFIDKERTIIRTKYGDMTIPKYYRTKFKDKYNNIYYINKHTKFNYLKKIYKQDKKALVLLVPSNEFNVNRFIFEGFTKKLYKQYFNDKEVSGFDAKHLKTDKANKIYNETLAKTLDFRSFVNRIVIAMGNDYSIRGDGEVPELTKTLEKWFIDNDSVQSPRDDYLKPDYCFPMTKLLKLHSQHNLELKGVMIDYVHHKFDTGKVDHMKEHFNDRIFRDKYQLGDNLEYEYGLEEENSHSFKNYNLISQHRLQVLYSVWPPTNKALYKFVYNTINKNSTFYKLRQSVLDIGSGTGILSILYNRAVDPRTCTFYCIDKNPQAIKNTIINLELNNMKCKTQKIDLTESTDLFPQTKHFDFILANPPWITAKPIDDLDSGNYDYKEKTLMSIFGVVKERLHPQRGSFMLIYSDLSEKLGLQEKDRVYQLCKEHSLIVKRRHEMKSEYYDKKIKTKLDAIKRDSVYLIYEIVKGA